jgi:hypothetical protein
LRFASFVIKAPFFIVDGEKTSGGRQKLGLAKCLLS